MGCRCSQRLRTCFTVLRRQRSAGHTQRHKYKHEYKAEPFEGGKA